MRKFLLLFLILTAPVLGEWTSGRITGEDVRLRSGPGVESTVVTVLPRGQLLGVLKRSEGWAQVFFPQAYVATQSLDGNVVKAGGARLLLDARPDSPVLANLDAGTQLEVYPTGELYRQVKTREPVTFWVSDRYISQDGLPVKEFVSRSRLKVSDADWAKLKALKGLRILVLPTDTPGQGDLVSSDDGRFGPSYSVKYKHNGEWFSVGAGTDGLGGYGVNVPELIVSSPLLGKVVIGTAGVPDHEDLLTEGTPLRNGSTSYNGPCPLTVFINCSPGMDRQVLKRAVESLRATRML